MVMKLMCLRDENSNLKNILKAEIIIVMKLMCQRDENSMKTPLKCHYLKRYMEETENMIEV